MTHPAQTPIERFTGTGSQTVFPVTAFGAGKSSEIEVYLDQTLQTEGVDYLITSLTTLSFNVDFSPSSDPGVDVVVTALRVTDLTQETDYIESDDFPAESHEAALDKLTRAVQDQERRQDASLELDPSLEPGTMQLPGGNKFLRMSADGASIAGVDSVTFTGILAVDALTAIQDLGVGISGRIIRYTAGDSAELITHGGAAEAIGALGAGVAGSLLRVLTGTTARQSTTASRSISSGPETLDSDDDLTLIVVDASGGPITVNLPALASAPPGYVVRVKKGDNSANAVTVAADGGDGSVIEGAASLILSAENESVRLVLNAGATEWNTTLGSGAGTASASLQVFTSSGIWNRPAGVKRVLVFALGAGGGGGGAAASAAGQGAAGGGGGAGALVASLLDVSSIASSTITIGAGGAAASPGANDGGDGGDTSWADGTNNVIGPGGAGGLGDASHATALGNQGGTGGNAGTGDILGTGAHGQPGLIDEFSATLSAFGGQGASSPFGTGGRGARTTGAGAGATTAGFGAGGGGGASVDSSAAAASSAGAPGLLFVLELP